MIEGNEGVFSEARCEHVLVRPELVPALSHYRVNHIDPWDFIFLFTFLDEFLHTLHNMFVKLDRRIADLVMEVILAFDIGGLTS